MRFCMEFGDTNFIGVVNAEKYQSFVDADWELNQLLQHFTYEMKAGNIIVIQMTEHGIEHSWNVEVNIGTETSEQKYFRKAEAYIRVTEGKLFLVDYDCLTMAAQFESNKVPDRNCSKYEIDIDNGIYKLQIVQYYNVDKNEYIGSNNIDILFNFTKVLDFREEIDKVLWCTF